MADSFGVLEILPIYAVHGTYLLDTSTACPYLGTLKWPAQVMRDLSLGQLLEDSLGSRIALALG